MRNFSMVAGLALVLAACGGGEQADTAADTAAAAPAAAPVAGATHDVNMVQEGANYLFVPAALTIRAGDVVNFHNVSACPHNVQFFADSIPAGSAEALNAGMPDNMGDLAGPLVAEPNAVYSISFANAPAGDYSFTCLPHMAMGMNGKVTVQP